MIFNVVFKRESGAKAGAKVKTVVYFFILFFGYTSKFNFTQQKNY